MTDVSAPVVCHSLTHSIEDRQSKVRLASLAGGNPTHDLCSVFNHLGGMKSPFTAREALNNNP